MDNDRNKGPDRPSSDAERWTHLSPRELALGTHADVHGLRKDIREAIGQATRAVLNAVEHSQSALMMRLDLIEKAIAKLGTGGTTPAEEARMAALTAQGAALVARVKAFDAER